MKNFNHKTDSLGWRKSIWQTVWLSVFAIALSACLPQGSELVIHSPSEGASVIDEAVDVSMSYQAAGAKPSVTLNGRDITSFVSFNQGSATVAQAAIDYALEQGGNVLTINQQGQASVSAKFTYDNAGPNVEFTSIERVGQNINVEGIARDASEVESLFINDQSISVNSNKEFSATLAQAESYGVKAEDEHGIKSYDHYLASGAELDPIIRASVDETLIDDISPLIAFAMIVPKEREIFDGINPLREFNILGQSLELNLTQFQGQVNASGELVDMATATVNSLVVSPDSSSGTVTADITLNQPLIGVEVMVGDVPLGLRIRTNKLDIKGANIRLAVDDNQALKVEFAENLPLDLDGTTIEIVDSGPGLQFLLGNPITNGIVNFVTNSIEGILSAVLPGLINAELAERLGDDFFPGLNIDDDNLRFKLGISSFDKSGSKVLANLTASYQAKSPISDAYAFGVKTPASIDQETGEVTVGEDLPMPKNAGQLNAAVSFDFLNQAMLLAHDSGLLDLNLVGGEPVVGEANVDAVAEDGALWIQVKPSVPELQLLGGSDQADVEVNLNRFEMNVRVRRGNRWANLMNLSVALKLEAGFGFNPENNALFLNVGDRAPIVDVLDIRTFGLPIPNGLANFVVDRSVPLVADLLSEFFVIDLPLPDDLPMQVRDISTLGSSGQFLNLSFDMDLLALGEILLNALNEEQAEQDAETAEAG